MSRRVRYIVQIGELRASDEPRSSDVGLRSVSVEIGMDAVGQATIGLARTALALPEPGAPVTIEIGSDEAPERVFTGALLSARPELDGATLCAADALAQAGRARAFGQFEEQTAGELVRTILERAGVACGQIEPGPLFARYTMHRGPRALQHLRELLRLCAMDLWVDPEGLAQLRRPAAPEAERSFAWGADLVAVHLERAAPCPAGVALFGEGAASLAGPARAHWLPQELGSVRGDAQLRGGPGGLHVASGAGDDAEFVRSGAVRSGELAAALARARAEARLHRPARGCATLWGASGARPGLGVALAGLPDGHPAKPLLPPALRVRTVRHQLDRVRGFTTELRF